MTILVECGPCCGSGQWPDRDGGNTDECPSCEGAGGWWVEVSRRLERQLRDLVLENMKQRMAGGVA